MRALIRSNGSRNPGEQRRYFEHACLERRNHMRAGSCAGCDGSASSLSKSTSTAVAPRRRALSPSPDHLHPSLAGYRAMAQAIPLTLFANCVEQALPK